MARSTGRHTFWPVSSPYLDRPTRRAALLREAYGRPRAGCSGRTRRRPSGHNVISTSSSAPRRQRRDGRRCLRRFTDRARRVVVLAQEEARMLNHNYIGTEHILLGLIHEGEGVAAKALESLGIALEGVRSQVEEIIGQGQQAPMRAHPVHAAGQEGPGAVAARGAAARPQLHRHRAHPARPDPRGRGRRRPGPGQAGCRPRPGPPAGHPAAVAATRARSPPRQRGGRGEGTPSDVAGARPVRSQPDPGRPRGQARPGHRPREGDRAGHAGAVPAHQEQPGPDRRAGRRQDRRRRGAGPGDRQGRGARDAQGQAALHAGPRLAGRRLPLPR